VLCISAILCFVYVFVCFYCSILFNRKVSIRLARVDVSAGNSLSTPPVLGSHVYHYCFIDYVFIISFY